jgi:hypothetical protein
MGFNVKDSKQQFKSQRLSARERKIFPIFTHISTQHSTGWNMSEEARKSVDGKTIDLLFIRCRNGHQKEKRGAARAKLADLIRTSLETQTRQVEWVAAREKVSRK